MYDKRGVGRGRRFESGPSARSLHEGRRVFCFNSKLIFNYKMKIIIFILSIISSKFALNSKSVSSNSHILKFSHNRK